MQSIDRTKPGEKKTLIWAGLLGFSALIVLWWALFGFGGSSSTPATAPRAAATPAATPARPQTAGTNRPVPPVSQNVADLSVFTPIQYQASSYTPPDVKRNIFAYYVEPVKEKPVAQEPTPTPPPPPPLLLASVSPSNVFARSPDFKLDIAGDKFTPATKIYFDGRELPTTYTSPQQLSANVPAALIATPGSRNILVRTADNTLYSATVSMNVAAAPTPNYAYVGIIGERTRVNDVAIVQDKSNKNIVNVHRGDVLSGRFRVTSISEKELVMMDTTLKIKHTLAMTEGDKGFGGNPMARPTPRVESEDDEP
jgi:hypothetical protein